VYTHKLSVLMGIACCVIALGAPGVRAETITVEGSRIHEAESMAGASISGATYRSTDQLTGEVYYDFSFQYAYRVCDEPGLSQYRSVNSDSPSSERLAVATAVNNMISGPARALLELQGQAVQVNFSYGWENYYVKYSGPPVPVAGTLQHGLRIPACS